MDVRLKDVLANQDLRLQKKVLHAHITQVVAERRERGPRPLGVLDRGFDEDVDVEGGARIAVDGECRRAEDHVPDIMGVWRPQRAFGVHVAAAPGPAPWTSGTSSRSAGRS